MLAGRLLKARSGARVVGARVGGLRRCLGGASSGPAMKSNIAARSRALVRCRRPAALSGVAKRAYTTMTDVARAYPEARVTTLDNGVRVVTEEFDGDETATVGMYIRTGSRFETEETNGVAHFAEHMFFKGTKTRERGQLEKEIEDMGGHLNAYTTRENTVFFARVMRDDAGRAVDLLSDVLTNSKFDANAVEQERGTILREMEEVEAMQDEYVLDRLHETAFRGSSLGFTILGPAENVRRISRDDIVKYHQTMYTGDRMVLVGAGGVKHEDVVELAKQKFGNVPAAPKSGAVSVPPAFFTGSDIRARFDSMEDCHVSYAFATAGWNDPASVPLMLMQTMLGTFTRGDPSAADSSSKLVSSLAADTDASYAGAFNAQYSDTGLFGVNITAPPGEHWEDIMLTVGNEVVRFAYEVDPKRLAEAKKNLVLGTMASNEGNTNVCEEIGRQMLAHGRRIHPTEMVARINAVTADDIKSAAERFIRDRDFALAAYGPTEDIPDYNFLRRRTYWLRY